MVLNMFRKLMPVVALTFLALFLSASSSAHDQFWFFLGDTQADLSQNHATIRMSRHGLHVRTIQLRVSGEPVFFDHLLIRFSDGASEELVVAGRISASGENYVIDLPDEGSLEKVELWYYQEQRAQNPTVSLYGIRLPDADGETAKESDRAKSR